MNELSVEARELTLYAENTYDLYQYALRLAEKQRDGKYYPENRKSRTTIGVACRRYANAVIRNYKQEFGDFPVTPALRNELTDYFENDVKNWEF